MDSLNPWLQNDLGLNNMNEEYMRGLIYHPHHGSLCRRFIKFLSESTLSTRRNPGLTASDDLNKIKDLIKDKTDKLSKIQEELHDLISRREEEELEIVELDERLKIKRNINEVLVLAESILEAISIRPKNYAKFEDDMKELRILLSAAYGNCDIYSIDLINDPNIKPIFSEQQSKNGAVDTATLKRKINNVTKAAKVSIHVISNLLDALSRCEVDLEAPLLRLPR